MNEYAIMDLTTGKHNQLLKCFIENLGDAVLTFRYFNKRDIEVVKSHLVSILLVKNNEPVAYGHLEKEANTVWLGICVLPEYKGQRIGSTIMKELISLGQQNNIESIDLTVDISNTNAISLYEKFNFKRVSSTATYYRYCLNL